MLAGNLTLIERVKDSSARWNPLRKVDTLGQFDFNTGVVMLDSLLIQDVQGVSLPELDSNQPIDMESFQKLSKVLPLAVHEYTHFVEATSTVWGLRHLKMLDKAYSCDFADESKFHVVRTYYTHLRRLKFPDYYTAVPNLYDATRPWQWRPSAGREFRHDGKPSERPIIFIRFSNTAGQLVARSPISLISLLETSAMSAEIEANLALIARIQDEGERTVQAAIYEDELFSYLYDVTLTEYSVCAHLVANRFNMPNARVSFLASSVIARTVLNSSKDVYSVVLKNFNVYLARVGLSGSDQESKMLRRSLANSDPGALFYIICLQMDRGALSSLPAFASGLVVAMRQLGVKFEFYIETALREAGGLHADLIGSSLNSVVEFAAAGFENLACMLGAYGMLKLSDMNLPPVLLGDDSEWRLHDATANRLRGFGVPDSYFELVEGQIKMEAFGDACL
ncbi:hypothetical protein RAM80_01595 [Pseudomonas sp. App30]|uniref:hypothetical protein n=1 Tax=Pseudomonas sp. App30 TaxID=3068990 RepID=UPI003A7FF5E8